MILEDKLMLINCHPVEELIAEAILQIAADSPPQMEADGQEIGRGLRECPHRAGVSLLVTEVSHQVTEVNLVMLTSSDRAQKYQGI